VSIFTVRKVSGGHEHPLVGVKELDGWLTDCSGHFPLPLSCFIWLV